MKAIDVMSTSSEVSYEDRLRIVQRNEEGLSRREIAQRLNGSYRTEVNRVQAHRPSGEAALAHKSRRPRTSRPLTTSALVPTLLAFVASSSCQRLAPASETPTDTSPRPSPSFAAGGPAPMTPAESTVEGKSHLLSGEEALAEHNYEKAVREFTIAIEEDPHSDRLYLLRGTAFLRLFEERFRTSGGWVSPSGGLNNPAVTDFEWAFHLNPHQTPESFSLRGDAYRTNGEPEKALADYNDATSLDPNLSLPYYGRGRIYETEGELELASTSYLQFLELAENSDLMLDADMRLQRTREYSACQRDLPADKAFGVSGSEPGQFGHPADVAVDPDGRVYVSELWNHRIQVFDTDFNPLMHWGTFVQNFDKPAPGEFYEPWSMAIDPQGNVFVTDTWNARIQKFDSSGSFVSMWGSTGIFPEMDMWGPRGIAIDDNGNVFVADSGNKRILVFDNDGGLLRQISQGGYAAGELDEPIGIAVSDGRVFVADTWNQRIQVFSTEGEFQSQWPVLAWFGQSIDNKPDIALDGKGQLFATDPERHRILAFEETGELLYCFGESGASATSLGLPRGLATDGRGGLYVADAANDRVMYFSIGD